MNKYLKILSLAIIFSFIWGAWWGFYSYEQERPDNKKGPLVRWLGLKGVMPVQFVEEFSIKNELQLHVTEMSTEAELLREALTHTENYDIIQISTFVSKSFLVENVFAPLNMDTVSNFKDVSVDFKSLDFDLDNKFLLPLTWGLNGFVVNAKEISLNTESINELMHPSSKLALIRSPVELFNLAIKFKPIIKTWVETGQNEELKKSLRELKSTMSHWPSDAIALLKEGKLNVVQTTNGEAAFLVGPGSQYRFVLPLERATLWINLIGVSVGARDIPFAHHVMNLLLQADTNKRLVEINKHSSVVNSSNESNLPLLQQAQFIRKVPLSRVELFINREAIEPIWQQAIQNEWGFQ
jgi:spermidine/putrescine transport system substrate-binding protein